MNSFSAHPSDYDSFMYTPSIAACPDAVFFIPGKGIDLHFLDLQIVIQLFSHETWIFIIRPELANA